MKLMYGNVPINTVKIKHFEMNTNDCTMEPSDLQAGITGVSKGRKIVGTGKCFEFATYGTWITNVPLVVPAMINIIQISSTVYPIRTLVPIYDITSLDFSSSQTIAEVVIDGVIYPISVSVQNGMLTVFCDHTIDIELFYGKDRYVKYGQ